MLVLRLKKFENVYLLNEENEELHIELCKLCIKSIDVIQNTCKVHVKSKDSLYVIANSKTTLCDDVIVDLDEFAVFSLANEQEVIAEICLVDVDQIHKQVKLSFKADKVIGIYREKLLKKAEQEAKQGLDEEDFDPSCN